MHKIHKVREMLCEELGTYSMKEKVDAQSLEMIDKLAHAIKNIDKIVDREEMMQYSNAMRSNNSYGNSYGGNSNNSYGNPYYEDMAYARGRGGNSRADMAYARGNSRMGMDMQEYNNQPYRQGM